MCVRGFHMCVGDFSEPSTGCYGGEALELLRKESCVPKMHITLYVLKPSLEGSE